VVHRTPQRIRIKIPRWERQDHDFAALQRALERCPGIVCVRVNALVASVVIHCRGDFEITSVRHYLVGLELVLPASGRGPWARQIAPVQRIYGHSTSSVAGLIVKLTIAIATRRLDALIKELILEVAVRALVQQLYRRLMQSPRLERPPQALLVAAAG